ncbi:SDR family oxidoreductase [Streptomyces sp. NPDC056013]|uniref:SDR family oxidoreductase n=1 Tax=Streptomyces sp. NPDC056013 TaxID=3345680 RepID=UPI0035D99EAC
MTTETNQTNDMNDANRATRHTSDPTPIPADSLRGRICLVAGATRGAGRGIAVQLGAAGATVYVTGRTTREKLSEVGRATETIEETAELVTAAGGEGIAVPTDHLEVDQVKALIDRIDRERGRLDVLVNDVWGGEHLLVFGDRTWESDLAGGLRMLELGVRTHAITSHTAIPLLIRNRGGLVVEVTDGTAEYNGTRYRENLFYDLAKNAPIRMAFGLGKELEEYGATAVSVTPGWLRSEQMLTAFGVTEENWHDAVEKIPGFAIAESPVYVGRAIAALAADPERHRWNRRSLSSGQLAGEYGFTDADGSRPDAWGFMLAEEKGSPDVNDYR